MSSKLPKPSLFSSRPSNIADTSSISSSTNPPGVPTSLLSGALPPSLLSDTGGLDGVTLSHVPTRPRRLWTVKDTALKPIPKQYPPMNPRCTTYVGDASPSVVAVRISECLRKRSIAVEYDEESNTATAMTVDRCQFTIQLWQGKVTEAVDFSHGVVVECQRLSGSTMSFHYVCRAVIQSALGQDTGIDRRPKRKTNPIEFQRLDAEHSVGSEASPSGPKRLRVDPAPALEHARELLKKDRFDTQVLGMERLVTLTCADVCSDEIALYISLQVLKGESSFLWKHVISEDQRRKQQQQGHRSPTNLLSACANGFFESSPSLPPGRTPDECRHDSRMRALALRVLCNALTNVANAKVLRSFVASPKNSHLIQSPLLYSLVTDLEGANRPPSVVEAGYQLASVHEAALAIRCLRLLGEHCPHVSEFLQMEHVLEKMELARSYGRGTHIVLQEEAERTYMKFTEDVRSC